MLIKEIHLIEGSYKKDIFFHDETNLIYSSSNSCGKTTLIRLILHGLGFMVPDLNGLELNSCQVKLVVTSGGSTYHTSRHNKYLVMKKNGEECGTYVMPRDSNEVLKELFQINNNQLIECVLGSMYIDQDRGWSLLNRGKVLGRNSFDIDKFISSFSNDQFYSLVEKRNALSNECKKYKKLINLFDRQRTLNNYSIERIDLSVLESLQVSLTTEKANLSYLKKEEKRLQHSLEDNKRFLQYIDQMKLVLNIDGAERLLTHDMIVSVPDNLNLINTRRKIIQTKIEKSKQVISNYEEQVDKYISQKNTEQIVESFSIIPLSKTDLNPLEIQASIDVMMKTINGMDSNIKELLNNNEALATIEHYIKRNSRFLGVYEYIVNKTPHCRIKEELKKYTGTDYKKIVLSYRLAYVSLIRDKCNVILPIIIDSPKNEVDRNNLNLMMGLLHEFYKDHQIIIASIDLIHTADHVIELKTSKKLIDDPQTHPSINEYLT